jgi:hypothetical protein
LSDANGLLIVYAVIVPKSGARPTGGIARRAATFNQSNCQEMEG